MIKGIIEIQEKFHLFSYDYWLEYSHQEKRSKHLTQFRSITDHHPRILLMVNDETKQNHLLERTIRSCVKPEYGNWFSRIIIVSSTKDNATTSNLSDSRIEILSIAGVSQKSFQLKICQEFDWVLFLESGDEILPEWINQIIGVIRDQTETEICYFDVEYLLASGNRQPFFKPDWSSEMMLSVNLLSRSFFSTPLINQLINSNEDITFFNETWLYKATAQATRILHIPTLFVRCNEPHPDYRRSNSSTGQLDNARILMDGLQIANPQVRYDQGNVRCSWNLNKYPSVSVIIPTRDNSPLLQRLIFSLCEKTTYEPFEVILLDNDSQDPATFFYYEVLRQDDRIKIIGLQEDFNYSRYNNIGAQHANGEVLIFLNNDMEVIAPDWMDELVRWAMLPEIGAVGGMLLYPDGSIQHAGIVIGLQGHASHVFLGESPDARTIFGRPTWYRNVSAVTGACLAVRKEVFEQVGGFDENLVLAFNDVEFCVRLIKAGYRNLYNPFVRLIHYEGRSRGKYIPPGDIIYGYEKLKDIVAEGDPYFNPNLSHLMNTPTLRRSFEGSPSERLEWIRANAVRKLKKND